MKATASTTILIGVICALIALIGCSNKAPMSKAQCDIGDWETLGYRDGALGRRSTQLLTLQEACIEYGIRADRDAYMRGWSTGAREYCVASNGYAAGERGVRHQNICPEDLRADFEAAYQKGRAIHLARTRVANLEADIEQSTLRLEQVRSDLISTAAAQLNPLLSPSRRGELVAELQGLNDEKNRLVSEIPRMHDELETRRGELAALNDQGFVP